MNIKMSRFDLFQYAVAIAALSGLINLRKEWPLRWKILLLLNILSFPVEGWAVWLAGHGHANHFIYDKWAPVETTGLLFVFKPGMLAKSLVGR
ncbi:MAG: hypothetical protein QM757_39510 [Paludibaculum sp.]